MDTNDTIGIQLRSSTMKPELKAWHVTKKTWPKKIIRSLPEGIFEIIPMAKRGIHNCKYCYFGQTNNGIHHCPEGYKCSFDDGTAIIFKKVGFSNLI